MKVNVILSFLLVITGFAAFGQEKQNGAAMEKGLTKVSVMYPYAEGKTFKPLIWNIMKPRTCLWWQSF
jgi:hypothetical protein